MADKKISQLTPATLPLAGTEVLPIVQNGSTVQVANNDLRPKQIQSNATSGVLQVVGPAAASTRVMTTPDANFTVARTDAAQNFTGNNTFDTTTLCVDSTNHRVGFGTNSPVSAITMNYSYLDTTGPGVITDVASRSGIKLYDESTGNFTLFVNNNSSNFGNILFKTNNGSLGERMRITNAGNVNITNGNLVIGTSGKGIDFSATASGSGTMTSELLADYEEGTWTPVLNRSSSSPTVTYGSQVGTYTKTGNIVTASITLIWSANSGGSGYFRITGLPYSVSSANYFAGYLGGIDGITFTAGCTQLCLTNETATSFALSCVGSAATNAYATTVGNTGVLTATVIYKV